MIQIIFCFIVLLLLLTIHQSNAQSTGIAWGTYTQIQPYVRTVPPSGLDFEFYKPSSTLSDWWIIAVFQADAQLGSYVCYGKIQGNGVILWRCISPQAKTFYRPSIRQIPPIYTKSNLLVTWVDMISKQMMSASVPPYPDGSNDDNSTIIDTWTVQTNNSNSTIQLYTYFYSSISSIYYKGSWYYTGACIITTSTSAPSGPAPMCFLISRDGGQSVSLLWQTSKTTSSPTIGPQIVQLQVSGNLILGFIYIDDNAPSKAYFVTTDGSSSGPLSSSICFASLTGLPFITTPALSVTSNSNQLVSIFTDSSAQYGAVYDIPSNSWIVTGRIYSSIQINNSIGVVTKYDTDLYFEGYGFFEGLDVLPYYENYE